MTGEDSSIVKMCNKCHMLALLDTIICPHCGGIVFTKVDLDTTTEKNNEE